MTYNFDPDRWFDIQQARLRRDFENGRITEQEHQERLAKLTEEYEKMLERMDIRHDYREE